MHGSGCRGVVCGLQVSGYGVEGPGCRVYGVNLQVCLPQLLRGRGARAPLFIWRKIQGLWKHPAPRWSPFQARGGGGHWSRRSYHLYHVGRIIFMTSGVSSLLHSHVNLEWLDKTSLKSTSATTTRCSGFRIQGAGFRVLGSGFKVQDSGFRVQVRGSRFRYLGFGFWV